ncbi:Sec63-domain-containing protein [Terfezia boudieri ATCC MYA-4762]|uniref:Sec63-domain-containing protein n=1 Tax=Terfezia boudieri ATCC MYA-4762 TaxID=1051890 RepID=A0A3N4LEI9_9PEZI|nr:Sec63-domain-containing protein [Terfezia boudieri ATCC MYA-4762]
MADPNQYKYAAMSNLVLRADKSLMDRVRRTDDATGDPESLAGKVNFREMGSRVARDVAPMDKLMKKKDKAEKGKKKTAQELEEEDMTAGARKRKRDAQSHGGVSTILISTNDITNLTYHPRTAATQATYSLILTLIHGLLGDVSHSVVRSAADAVLEILKDTESGKKDFDKQKEIEELLTENIDSKKYNELVNLSKKITDYDVDDDEEMGDKADKEGGEEELDDRAGVAVVFDEDDEDEDDVGEYEVKEGDTSDEEGEDAEMAADEDKLEAEERKDEKDDEDEMVIDFASQKKTDEDKDIIPAHTIDAFWLQRQISEIFQDAHITSEKSTEAFNILAADEDDMPLRQKENDLIELLDYSFDLVKVLMKNTAKIVWCTRLARAAEGEEKAAVEKQMIQAGAGRILDELRGREAGNFKKTAADQSAMDIDVPADRKEGRGHGNLTHIGLQPRRINVIENLIFEQGNHLMTNASVKLPQGSTKRTFKGYEEIHVPAPKRKHDPSEPKLIPITSMPEWARTPFSISGTKELNRIQTKCYPAAFEDDGNLLICAPTGSGKTNVAMLTILREIGKHRDELSGRIKLDDFKIVYIAPLKALVQEQVGNFGKRLEPYGIKVSELTGDRQLTKQQIIETQIIVTTPEKWDVITRKATDLSYTNLVRLIILDEIHLLHDERGPVLESIVSRTIRKMEQTLEPVRLVGLSATLPNYRDVASFLRVDALKGLFWFDATFRPCPLKQEFIGVTDKKPIKQLQAMNDVAYTKVIEQAGDNQMLIFVHSRKDTAKTAKYIRDKAVELETIGKILKSDAATREILRTEADNVSDANLKDLLPYGFAIHHAGMNRADRTTVEDLFAEKAVQVLVCTATLAWGVNLPAHTVIIKGTQIYSPEKGAWVELGPQDVLQMLGRAGRPQFDTYGEGIIITTQSEVQYYLSLLNQQLPIESQFMRKLADNLNAEIVLGTVRTRDEAVEWLGYTYLYVRMLRSPGIYSVGADYSDDEALEQKRVDLIHSAATILEKCRLVKYDKKTGKLQGTELGRIASHYYISHDSMLTYSHHLQPGLSPIELFRVFALSEEFKYIPVRHEEKVELAQLLGRVPIPVKEGVEEPQSKINVLLQAYISRLKLGGLALVADMVYVTQSAGRILRAIFEICLKRGWASVAKTTLDICKMVEKRMWLTMSPLRQFPNCPREVITKVERMDVDWQRFFDMDPPTIGEALGMPRQGKLVHALLQRFPRLEVQAQVQPITRTMLRVELTITPSFEWDDTIHGAAESWWIVVEDCDGEEILFHDQFVLRRQYALNDTEGGNEHLVEFTVPVQDPMPPNYFITLISDRWIHAETKLAVSFRKLVLPDKFPPHTPLLDLQPLPVMALKKREFVDLYPHWEKFNKIQTQVFNSLFTTDDNVFIGAPTGSGKTVCAEFALLRHWSKGGEDVGRAVYIAPFQELVDRRYQDWKERLSHIGGGKEIVKLTSDTTADLKLLEKGELILATPSQWDVLSRAWQRRKNIQTVQLFIADELHMLGGQTGYIYEIIVSRMIYIAAQTERPMRIVALSVSLSNGKNLGEWIGADKHSIYNFSPRDRPVPLEIHIQSSSIPHFPSMMLAMAKPVYLAISEVPPNKPIIVFVPSRKQARATALDLHSYCLADDKEDAFLNAGIHEIAPHLSKIQERTLAESISRGIGYYHEALCKADKRIVEHLFQAGAFKVLLASRDTAWELDCTAAVVIVMGTQFFEGREHRYIDYPLAEVLQMFGRACRPEEDKIGKAILLCPATRKEYYRKFLNEALPIESHLHLYLHDAFVTEISTKTIASTQDAVDWMTYTYFYRRLLQNPSFYSLADRSHDGLSAFLSEMVENTLKELAEAKIIDVDEEDDSITPLNAAMIAAYYNISFITMQTFLLSLTGKTKLKGILEIVTSATEFESIPIRRHEDRVLQTIYDNVPVKMSQPNYESPHFKAFTLLQAHFSRMKLVADLATDQTLVLSKIINLLSACVDILSSDGHLNALSAMEMSQMCVQALWDRDSPLLQIPHFSPAVVKAAEVAGIKDVFEFMDQMDPENPNRETLLQKLGLNQQQLAQVANFTNNKYPSVDMEHEVLDVESVTAGLPAYVQVTLDRGLEDDEEPDFRVHAPYYPGQKTENWWLVIGEESTKSLLAIKRVTIGRKLTVKLEYVVPTPGRHTLSLSLMCDSYVGVDQEQKFEVDAAEGMDEDEEEEEEDE